MISEVMDENGVFTEEFGKQLPTMLGDDYFNDLDTKQQPTKMFDNIKDISSLVKMAATAQRKATQNEAKYAEKYKGMVKIPDENAKLEEVAAYRKAIGASDKPEDFELSIPDDDDKAGFEAIANVVRVAAHEAGIPKKVLSGIWNKIVTTLKAQDDALVNKGLALEEADQQALKDKHKENYPVFIKSGNEARAKFKSGKAFEDLLKMHGIDDYPQTREFLAEIAPLVLEGHTVAGAGEGAAAEGEAWPLTYKYDPITGKPI